MKKYLVLFILLFSLVAGSAVAGFDDGGFSSENLFKRTGNAVTFLTSTWELGSSSDRIAKIYATAGDFTTLVFGGVVAGDLDLNGNKMVIDQDADTYLQEISDDNIGYNVGGTTSSLSLANGQGFPAGLLITYDKNIGPTVVPSALVIENFPSSINTGFTVFGNENSTDFNDMKCYIVGEAVTIHDNNQVTFTTDLETLNIARAGYDFVIIKDTDGNEDGVYTTNSVSTTTATVQRVTQQNPNFTSTTGTANYCTLKIAFGYEGINTLLTLQDGYTSDNTMISLSQFGGANANDIISIAQNNSLFDNSIFSVNTGATTLGNNGVFDVTMNSAGRVLNVGGSANSTDPLYGLYISLTNTGGAAYNYLANNLGIGNTTPSVGLHVGQSSSGQGLTSGNDAIISGSLEVAGSVFATGGMMIPNGTALPGACIIGQLFQDTDSNDCADTGSGDGALCICKASNTWALISNF